MNLDDYIKTILTLYLFESGNKTLIVTNSFDECKIINERIITIHKELPSWLGLKILKGSTIKETLFSSHSSIAIVINASYGKGMTFKHLGYFDKFNKNNPPSAINDFGKKFTIINYEKN